jgi:hypothetical protein
MELDFRPWCQCVELCWRVSFPGPMILAAFADMSSFSIFGTLGGEADFGPAAYSNAVTKRSVMGKRNAPVRLL